MPLHFEGLTIKTCQTNKLRTTYH